jgi:hypothetical protein
VSGLPIGVTIDSKGFFIPAPGSVKVYQALSTRNGGEVIGADSY